MVSEKKNMFVKILSVIMALVMCLSFTLPVFAATSKTVKVNSSTNCTKVWITTGTGLAYSLGTKKTTVTVKNTGSGRVAVYKNIGSNYMYDGELAPGQTKTYTAKGSGKKYYVMFQKTTRTSSTVRVSTSAGSVY